MTVSPVVVVVQMEMEDGDQVDVMLQQTGGGVE